MACISGGALWLAFHDWQVEPCGLHFIIGRWSHVACISLLAGGALWLAFHDWQVKPCGLHFLIGRWSPVACIS